MSTKLYNGLKLKDPTKLWEFERFLREKYDKLKNSKLIEEITVLAFEAYDAQRGGWNNDLIDQAKKLYPGIETFSLSMLLRTSISSDLKFDQSRQKKELDSVGVFHNPIRNEIYLYCYHSLHELTEAIKLADLVEDFHYYDNSDRPEGISEQDWRDRLRAWEETIDLGLPLGAQGMQIVLENEYKHNYITVPRYVIKVEELGGMFALPSFNRRVKHISQLILIEEYTSVNPANLSGVFYYITDSDNLKRVSPQAKKLVEGVSREQFFDEILPELVGKTEPPVPAPLSDLP